MAFIYELEPYAFEVYRVCENELPAYVKCFESYRLTDRHTDTTKIIYHAASPVVNNLLGGDDYAECIGFQAADVTA